ncbi:FMN-linked oxidoreductases superfamily protein [Actinidia rufa]|uniref:FMN-linked oxidoreductases superfamily protein n=1 Tax=Actinidia rufa TaxID=165716 RepID=A0A7J0F5A4_9ERIC|nr:FMN-linked oxidoreductases superfamily protein [Actinidia rufa]
MIIFSSFPFLLQNSKRSLRVRETDSTHPNCNPIFRTTSELTGGDGQRFHSHRRRLRLKPSSSSAFSLFTKRKPSLNSSLSSINSFMAAASSLSLLPSDDDDRLCSETAQQEEPEQHEDCSKGPPSRYLGGESRIERAWAHWKKLGQPKLIVAPMVDNSELPFRMLCRKYGAEAAYTPMLHSRIFTETEKYRTLEFTTCKSLSPCLPYRALHAIVGSSGSPFSGAGQLGGSELLVRLILIWILLVPILASLFELGDSELCRARELCLLCSSFDSLNIIKCLLDFFLPQLPLAFGWFSDVPL